MKVLPYSISAQALDDLDEIWLFTVGKWSLEQANRYYNLIFDEVDRICKYPESGKSIAYIRHGYKVVKVKSHLLFYRVINNTIEVVRILHERMDIESHLKE